MNLPPLNPLRAFEAAARHGSFLMAAEELCVTPGAISRQIKALEEHLGFSLFRRSHNGVQVEANAKTYQEALRAAFLLIEKSTKEIAADQSAKPLNIWCSRLFMRQWLVRKLAAFQDENPDIEVQVRSGRSTEPMPDNTDLAIRWGNGDFAPWTSHHLMDSHLTAVCSPEYIKTHGMPKDAQDIQRYTLLFSGTRLEDWRVWFSAAGVKEPKIKKKLVLEGDGLTLRAAMEGVGIAIGRREFIAPDVEAKRLVIIGDINYRLAEQFWLIYPPAMVLPEKTRRFRDWLLREV